MTSTGLTMHPNRYFILVYFAIAIALLAVDSMAAEESITFSGQELAVEENAEVARVFLRTGESLEVHSFLLRSPDRLVIDLIGLDRKPPPQYLPKALQFVTALRFGRHRDKLRIVFDLQPGYVKLESSAPTVSQGIEHEVFLRNGLLSLQPKPPARPGKVMSLAYEHSSFEKSPELTLAVPAVLTRQMPPLALKTVSEIASSSVTTRTTLPPPLSRRSLRQEEVQSSGGLLRESEENVQAPVHNRESRPEQPAGLPLVEDSVSNPFPVRGEAVHHNDPARTLQALFDEDRPSTSFTSSDIALFTLAGVLILVLLAFRYKQRSIKASRDRLFPQTAQDELEGGWHAILGCAQDASNSAIKSRYRQLIKTYHRDTLEKQEIPEEIRRLSEAQLVKVHEAYLQARQERGF